MILPSTPTTDFLGAFETSFQVPSMPNGTYTFSTQDDDGNAAKTLITIAPRILTQPTSATPNTFVLIYGYGFSAPAEFTLLFDSIDLTPYGTNMTSPEGFFITALFVPNVSSGIHSISAHDSIGNSANCPFATPSPIMMLNPNAISESTIVTIEGTGFKPDAPVELYLEDTITTSVYDLMATTEDIMPKADGSFQYSFMVPITRAGTFEVTAYEALGLLPSDLPKVASATLTVIEHALLDADITAGTMHFRGEMAEFYLKAALKGELVDAQIDRATIHSVSGSFEQDLRSNVTQISTGFYRIPCQIPDAASFGTYALLIEISLRTNLLEAYGSTTGSFMISPFFTMQAAQLLDIQNNIATIIIPELGTVKANLSTINAKLGSIEGNVAFIESDIGTLRTSTEAIHATVASIEDDVVTIWSDVGTIRVKMTESGNQINVAALFAVAAAIVSSASAAILYRRKPPKPPTAPSASPPEEGPPPQSAPAPTQPEEQERRQTQTETPAEVPKPAETPPQETQSSVEPPPQKQSPPDSNTSKEPPTQPQSEPQPQPQTIVVQPEQPVPQ